MKNIKHILILFISILIIYGFRIRDNSENIYIKLYLSDGHIYYNEKLIPNKNIVENLEYIHAEQCSLLPEDNCNRLKYLFIIDTTELAKNISLLMNKLSKKSIIPFAYFVTNKKEDSIYTNISLPIDNFSKEYKKIIKNNSKKIDRIYVGNNFVNYNNENLKEGRLTEVIDSLLFDNKNVISIYPEKNSRFCRTIEFYRFYQERYTKFRDEKSIEILGINFFEAERKIQQDNVPIAFETKYYDFEKEYRPKVILDFLNDFE